MNRKCCNTLTILLAGLLLAGPAISADSPSVSEKKSTGDYSAQPVTGKDSPAKLGTTGEGSVQPGVGKDSSSMSESKSGLGKDSSSVSESKSGSGFGKDNSSMSERKATGHSSLGSASKDSGIAATSLSQDQVRELQRLLGEEGHSAGQIDGIIGPRTQAAIRQFQTANNLTVSGNADQETLRALAPDAKKQEFFGVAPAYGDAEGGQQQPMRSSPSGSMDHMEQPYKKQPAEKLEQPMKSPSEGTQQPMKNESGTDQSPKKSY